MLPDYAGGSLVNLMASLVAASGGRPRHPGLKDVSFERTRNIILFIVDGLGERILARHGRGGELERRRRQAITSVFPSTTASAITTSYTARTPLEHGLTGWFTYFGEAGCVAAPLPFRSRGDNASLRTRGLMPDRAFTARSIFQELPLRSIVVTHKDIVDSDYNVRHCTGAERRAYATLDELVDGVVGAAKSSSERKFIYTYWPDYDALSHRYGCEGPEALRALHAVDEAFGRLLARLAGTESLVVATADHGFIDAESCLEPPAAISSQLRFPFCGERRVAYCHVHAVDDFMERAKDWVQDRGDVRRSSDLLAEGWFGPGEPHPRFAERIGDVALVMRARHTVKDWAPGEPSHLHIGNHGGTSEDEMLIPLIVEAT
ncbi:MAG: alkaline phosphatase family protein [Betaproteobacteria bacterium]